jgi:hypothetical protein
MYGINNKQYNIIPNKYYSIYNLGNLNSRTQSVSKRTTVSLDMQIYQRLRSRGHFGESFSDVLTRVLDQLENTDGGAMEH